MEGLDEVRARLAMVSDPLALLEGIFAYAPVGLQVYHADGHCLLTNRAFRDLFGGEPPPEYNLLRDDIAEKRGVLGLVKRAFAGETIQTPALWYDPRELQQVKVTTGKRVAISANFFPLYARNGAVEHVAIVFKDETAEVEARERVEASESLLRQVIDGTTDVVYVKDRAGRYLMMNAAGAVVMGRQRPDQVVGRRPSELLPAAEAAVIEENDRRVVDSGVTETLEHAITVGGQVRHFWTAKSPRRDASGAVVGLIGVSRDITDRKHAEEALADQERWLEMVLDRMPMPLIFIEPVTARVLFANAAAERLAGGSLPRPQAPEDYPRLHDLRDLDDRRLTVDEVPAVRAARGESLEGVQIRWHLAGGPKVVTTHSARLASAHGHPEIVLLAFDDITALKDVQAQLEEAVRVRQDFLSIAGHELKTPLTSMALNARVVDGTLRASPLLTDERMATRWRALVRQIDRLDGLIDQLLDVSRITAGRLELQPEPLELGEVVRDVVARFDNGRVRLESPAPLPGRWDRLRVEQIVTNLVSNAVKYGEGQPVTVELRGAPGTVFIVVRDQGIGIAPDAVARIFDRFERAVSERHYGGLGLGLWIVSQVAQAMGGSVSVESAPGRGATFTVRLPRGD